MSFADVPHVRSRFSHWDPRPLAGTSSIAAAHKRDRVWRGVAWAFWLVVALIAGAWASADGVRPALVDRFEKVVRPATALVFDPSDQRTVYGAFGNDGVDLSRDGGRSWVRVSRGLEVPWVATRGYCCWEIFGLSFSREVPPRLFAATKGGLFVLEDGRLWRRLSLPLPNLPRVSTVAFEVRDRNVIWAATDSGPFRSTDRGATWEQRHVGLPNARGTKDDIRVTGLAVNPANANNVVACVDGFGVYRSDDAGGSWKAALGLQPTASGTCRAIQFSPDGSTVAVGGGIDGVRTSRDQGRTWEAPAIPRPTYVSTLVFDASGRTLYATGTWDWRSASVWKSRDSGRTWVLPPRLSVAPCDLGPLAIDPRNRLHVLLGTWLGVLSSSDGGSSWSATDRLGIAVLSLAVDAGDHPVAYAGMDRGGVLRSADAGESWQPVGLGDESVTHLVALPDVPGVVIAGTATSGLFRSEDGGRHWAAARIAGLPPDVCGQDPNCPLKVTALAADRAEKPLLYAAVERAGVLRSNDLGVSWSTVQSRGPGLGLVSGMAISGLDRHLLVFVERGGDLLVSNDGGASLKSVTSDSDTDGYPTDIAWDGAERSFLAARRHHLFRSREGLHWVEIANSLRALTKGGQKAAEFADDEAELGRFPCERTVLAAPVVNGGMYAACEDVVVKIEAGWRGFQSVQQFPPPPVRFGAERHYLDPRRHIVAIASSGPFVLVANGYGIFRSGDGGSSWDMSLPLWLRPVPLDDE
jgi:hypothetical protein